MDFITEFCDFYNDIEFATCNVDMPDYIYHYTSSGGAKGIFDKANLRFTDRCFLNDKSEGFYVLSLCKNNIDKLITKESRFKDSFCKYLEGKKYLVTEDEFRVFQCSFSEDSDSLCMWNYYTKSNGVKGYNVRFNTADIVENMKLGTEEKKGGIPKILLGKVIYDIEEQIQILKDLIDKFSNYAELNPEKADFIASYAVKKILQQGAFFKQECFAIEKEYRLVINLFLAGNKYIGIENESEFMERNNIFIPYVDIKFSPEVLTGITISPTLDSETTRLSLKLFTQKNFNHLSDDDIHASAIPVRY